MPASIDWASSPIGFGRNRVVLVELGPVGWQLLFEATKADVIEAESTGSSTGAFLTRIPRNEGVESRRNWIVRCDIRYVRGRIDDRVCLFFFLGASFLTECHDQSGRRK